MAFSINTNAGSLVALQNLTATQMQLQQTQNIISTGKNVNTATGQRRQLGPSPTP